MNRDSGNVVEPPGSLFESLERHLPNLTLHSMRRLGEGMDNAAWEVNGELIVRQAKDSDVVKRAEAVRREAALLREVARISPLPVPEPVFADAEAGVLAYLRLPGMPLKLLPSIRPEAVAPALGAFLDAIHRAPAVRMETLAERDSYPLPDWLRDAQRDYRVIAGHLSTAQRALIEEFLGQTPPPEPETLTFCHNDLGSEHVLVDPASGAVTGVIDWTDAAIADPARDFALLYRDLGPEALDAVLALYQRPLDDVERERVLFHARCALIEDIAYGLTGGEAIYADAGLARFDRTFAAAWGGGPAER